MLHEEKHGWAALRSLQSTVVMWSRGSLLNAWGIWSRNLCVAKLERAPKVSTPRSTGAHFGETDPRVGVRTHQKQIRTVQNLGLGLGLVGVLPLAESQAAPV